MRMRAVLLLSLGLAGCRAIDPALLAPTAVPLAPRLPPLAAAVRVRHLYPAADSQQLKTDLDTLFAREARTVLAAAGGPPQGTLLLTVDCVRYREGIGFAMLTGGSLGALTLLGLPWARFRGTVDVQLDVRNQRQELIGTYYGQGQATLTGGLYRRTSFRHPPRVLQLQCVRQALAAIVPQVQAEAPRLRAALAR